MIILHLYKKGTEIDSDLIITGTILATIGNINRFSSFPISTIAASTSLLTSELQAIQLLEKCLKNDTILISDNEKNTLYNIIHTCYNTFKMLYIYIFSSVYTDNFRPSGHCIG